MLLQRSRATPIIMHRKMFHSEVILRMEQSKNETEKRDYICAWYGYSAAWGGRGGATFPLVCTALNIFSFWNCTNSASVVWIHISNFRYMYMYRYRYVNIHITYTKSLYILWEVHIDVCISLMLYRKGGAHLLMPLNVDMSSWQRFYWRKGQVLTWQDRWGVIGVWVKNTSLK